MSTSPPRSCSTSSSTTTGQLSAISEIARRQIDYYHGLPASLKGVESTRNGALAMIAYAHSEAFQGHTRQADGSVREAVALLENARARGDDSQATTIALIDSVPPEVAKLRSTTRWRQLIRGGSGAPH
jgi:hypothetical protein